MRKKIHEQLSIVEPAVNHRHSLELAVAKKMLSECPEVADFVYADLIRNLSDPESGRESMLSSEQVYLSLLIKQWEGLSYDELSFHLRDSRTYQALCGFGWNDDIPSESTLQRDIKKIRPETLEAINRVFLGYASAQGIEKGRMTRFDCTVVESNIHEPTDSSLLEDCVRVLSRTIQYAKEKLNKEIVFSDHSRRAKRRAMNILNAKRQQARLQPYKDLLKVARLTINYANGAIEKLDKTVTGSQTTLARIMATTNELKHYVNLALKVVDQTQRRVIDGQKVPASEKVVSIFEPHTDIIIKDNRTTYYGHKVTIAGGVSGLITDLVIEDGNPADATLAVNMVTRQKEIYGRVPRQVAFDGGFAARSNLAQIKMAGVKDVSFSKGRGLEQAEMTKSQWVYKKLRDFRAGIEGIISFLKRGVGMRRCNWRGLESFKSYAWACVTAANALLIARRQIAAAE